MDETRARIISRYLISIFLASFMCGMPLHGKKSSPSKSDIDLSFLDSNSNEPSKEDDFNAENPEDDELPKLYGNFIEYSNNISSAIQHLCQLTVQERTVGKKRTKIDAVIDWLNAIQVENNKIRNHPIMPIDHEQLYTCLSAQLHIIKTLQESVTYSFRRLPNIAPLIDDALESDPNRNALDSEQVLKRNERVAKALTTLLQNVEGCGLSGFNKFYTKISPIVPWAVLSGAIATTAFIGTKIYEKSKNLSPDSQIILNNALTKGQTDIIAGLEQSVFGAALGAIIPSYKLINKYYGVIDSYLRGNKFKLTNEQVIVDDIDLDDPCFAHMREKLQPIYRMVEYIKNPQKFSLAGIKNYKAILLVGEPGSGKSYLARAIAGQLQKTVGHSVMISVTIDHYIEKGGIKRIFEDAKQRSGCVVLFLDEIHLYGVQAEKNVQGLQELLACLDDLDRETDPRKQIFIIAATNRPDLIEDPLKRQGRFGTIIELTKPLLADRINILTTLCKKSAVNPDELQVKRLAQLTTNRPMSDIMSMFSQACFLAKNENKPLSFDHMYRALNMKLRKLSETLNLSPEEATVVSMHLAGKICALLNLKTSQHLDMVTLYSEQRKIVARYDIIAKIKNDEDKFFVPDPGIIYTYEDNELISNIGQKDVFAPAKILLAGPIAQRLFLGAETSYHIQDREKALDAILKVISGGINLKKLARKEHDELLLKASEALKICEKETEKMLTEHKEEIELLAKKLAEAKMLLAEEIHQILGKNN